MPFAATPPPPPSTRRLKVLLAIDGLGIGGAEMVVRDLALRLDPGRFAVAVCCTKSLGTTADRLLRDGADVFVLPKRTDGRVDYLTPLKLRRAVIERGVDIVHTHAPAAFWDAAICKLLLPRVKVINTFHFGNYPHISRSLKWMERAASHAADRLVAVGRQQREAILATYALSPRRMDTIWNGAPEAHEDDTRPFRERSGAAGRLVVGTIAKLIPQKGLDDLLLVAKRSRESQLPLHFVVLGEGPLRAHLEQRRRELGVEDSVTLMGWFENAAGRALPAIDVFFQPSHWEAMSIAVLEAMAAGRAILATRVGDNPHVIEDGVTGMLSDVGDIDGMVLALRQLCDEALRQRLGLAARADYERRFTLDHMVRAYEDLYAAVAAGQR
jgi:glycosyltransferase involved in cell wall biosynthesis